MAALLEFRPVQGVTTAAETIALRRAFLAELRLDRCTRITVLTKTGLTRPMTLANEGENVDRHR